MMVGARPFLACGPDASFLLWALSPILIPFAAPICLSLAMACMNSPTARRRERRRGFEVLARDRHA